MPTRLRESQKTTKCEELLKRLNEYLLGTEDPDVCEEFEMHVIGCHSCPVVVDNIRKTITLCQNGQPYGLPVALFRTKLQATLHERWREKHPVKSSAG